MSRKLAVKKLTESDLSFFHVNVVRYPNKGKQKAFNLDRRVLEKTFYPDIAAVIDADPEKRAGLVLSFFGPGSASRHLLTRKILKAEKNWRLNGEDVSNPHDQPGRYDVLAPGDFALMEFSGVGAPSSVKAVLIAANHDADASTHRAIQSMFGDFSMLVLTDGDIERIVAVGAPAITHPIRDWLDASLIEDVGQGGGNAAEILNSTRRGRGISEIELRNAKLAAERVGKSGEELLDQLFRANQYPDVAGHEWVAKINAISPFDFRLSMSDGVERHVDAKSTAGPFQNPIHLSLGEIRHAMHSGVPYDIFRLYEVKEYSACFRVAKNIAAQLAPVLEVITALPDGVDVDSLSFAPDVFTFETAIHAINFEDLPEPE